MRYLYTLIWMLLVVQASAQTRYLRALEQSSGAWQFISLNVNTEEKTLLTLLPDSLAPWSSISTFDASLQRYYYIAITPENVRKLVTLNAFSGDIVSIVNCPGVNGISAGNDGQLYGFQYNPVAQGTFAVRINPLTGLHSPLYNVGSYLLGFTANASAAHPSQPFFFVNGTHWSGQGNVVIVSNTASGQVIYSDFLDAGSMRILRGHSGNGNMYGIRFYFTPRRCELFRIACDRPEEIVAVNDSLHVSDVAHGDGTLLAATEELFVAATVDGQQQLTVFDLRNGNIVKRFNPGSGFQCYEATLFGPDHATNRISGNVYLDQDADGERDAPEPGLMNQLISVEPGGYRLFSGRTGNFSLPLPAGTYTVKIIPSGPYSVSSDSLQYTVRFNGSGEERGNLDFGLAMPGGGGGNPPEDLSVKITSGNTAVGRETTQTITIRNNGSTAASGKATYEKGEHLIVTGTSQPPSSVNGSRYEFDVGDLLPGETRVIVVRVAVPPDPGLIGQVVESTVKLEAETESGETFVKEDRCRTKILTSSDPNDKQVNGDFSADILPGATLRYLIRFQNVGNDTAYRVVIRDTLAPELIAESFRMLASSHDYTVYAKGNELVWEFDNILLPDSGANREGSNGFVDFEIQCTGSLPQGHSFANTAAIYFDYNPPVITNAAVASYPLGIYIPYPHPELALYPNPAGETVSLRLLKKRPGRSVIMLQDVSGKELLRLPVPVIQEQLTLPLHGLAAGIYCVSVWNAENGEYATTRLLLAR